MITKQLNKGDIVNYEGKDYEVIQDFGDSIYIKRGTTSMMIFKNHKQLRYEKPNI